jgi:xylono-1,5-lactonase
MSKIPNYSSPIIISEPQCVWPAKAQLGEGTLWSVRKQALYWVDILGMQLFKFDPITGNKTQWLFTEPISALAERVAGDELMITLRSGFALFNPLTNQLTKLSNPEPDRLNNRFNDAKCDPQGRFWAGSMDIDCKTPTGALYRFNADQTWSIHDDGYAVTNGPTWSLDGQTFYFTNSAKATVFAFDFDAVNGTLSNKRPWLKFEAADGVPDGMTTDADGRLWIAHWGGSCVTCRDPISAKQLARVNLPTRFITNCAFGGPDLQTLFISSARAGLTENELASEPLAGGLFSVRVASKGLAANQYAG